MSKYSRQQRQDHGYLKDAEDVMHHLAGVFNRRHRWTFLTNYHDGRLSLNMLALLLQERDVAGLACGFCPFTNPVTSRPDKLSFLTAPKENLSALDLCEALRGVGRSEEPDDEQDIICFCDRDTDVAGIFILCDAIRRGTCQVVSAELN
jgi:hypothetical protein